MRCRLTSTSGTANYLDPRGNREGQVTDGYEEDADPPDDLSERQNADQTRRSRWLSSFRHRRSQAGRRLDSVERSFLSVLRGAALGAAAVLVLGSVIMLVLGFGLQIQSPDSVKAEQIEVTAQDLAPVQTSPSRPEARPEAQEPRWARVLPADFRRRYYQLYRTAFAPSYRRNEKPLEERPFFEQLFPDQVLDQIEFTDASLLKANQAEGEGEEQSGSRTVLGELVAAVESAAGQPSIRRELQGYQAARQVEVCRDVQRTRTRWVERWDYSATNCPYWFEPPYGCMGRRQVSEPYQARTCSMQFPENVPNPAQVLRSLQDRFFYALNDKVAGSMRDAELRRQQIVERNAFGRDTVWKAVLAFAAFLSLMFLYLLVALERHHRAIRAKLAPAASEAEPAG